MTARPGTSPRNRDEPNGRGRSPRPEPAEPQAPAISQAAGRSDQSVAPDAIAALDVLLRGTGNDFLVLTDSRLRITRAGATAAGLAERPLADLPGMSLIAAFGSVALDGIAREALERRTQRQGEVRLGHLGTRVFQVDALPYRTDGLLLFLHDVTSVRRVEQVRRDFIANISHELRTPLSSIKLIAETLSGGAVDDMVTARDFAGQIEREVDHLAQLVDELLELSMIESGEVQLQIEPTAPADIVASVVERLQPLAERNRITLLALPGPGGPSSTLRAAADSARVEQALVNLVHNAVKFSHPEGTVEVDWHTRPGHIRFTVRDQGIGISASHLPRIFERFYKVDRSRARSSDGLGTELRTGSAGLGLAIVRHIAEAHHGMVGAESQEGEGSTFWIDIPAA
jgi:two-component system phosphate regulon sensor histidine kinase PhoR